MNSERKKYFIVLIITIGIFVVVFGLVNFLNNKRLENVDDLQHKVTIDLLATETQFELLKTAPCGSAENTILSRELGELGQKLDFAETNQGSNNLDVLRLKKYYSLLQVKDYLLMEELSRKCEIAIDSILYFYEDNCSECTKQGYVLTELKNRYPELRIYSFDTDLDFSVIETFASLYDFGEVFPAIIVEDKSYQGLQKISDIELLFPDMVERRANQKEINKIIELVSQKYSYPEEIIKVIKKTNSNYSFTINGTEKGEIVLDENGNRDIQLKEVKEINI